FSGQLAVRAVMLVQAALIGCFPGVRACLAQSSKGTIYGTVTDAQSLAIPGVQVAAIHSATGVRVAVKTNDAGLYSIPSLDIGAYAIAFEKQGFRKYEHTGIILTTAQTLELDAILDLGAVTETIHVTASEPQANTLTPDVSQLVDSKSIEDLPLGNRRTMNIIQMTGAAVFLSAGSAAVGGNPTYSLAGGRLQSQMVWIDGGTGQNVRIAVASQNIDPPAETVQELRVLSNNYAAEYGGSVGGVIVQTTKSGTN